MSIVTKITCLTTERIYNIMSNWLVIARRKK